MSNLNTQPLWDWVNERHAVYIRKGVREGQALNTLHVPLQAAESYAAEFEWGAWGEYPLTLDPILQQYRFCNVFRELDRVSVWVRENIRDRWADHPNLWLMLAIARYINWPDTLQFLIDTGYAWPDRDDWKPEDLGRALEYRARLGHKVYTGAYMIRAESNPNAPWYNWSKHQYIAQIVIGRLWEDRADWEAYLTTDDPENQLLTIRDVWEKFQTPRYIGWGPFMAYQVCVDMRWTRYLERAPDINLWAAVGPGSRRGLNRLAGRPLEFNLKQDSALDEMRAIWAEQDQFRAPWVPPIDLSDIQNALCETDKYLRVKLGEGKPRSSYVPGRGY